MEEIFCTKIEISLARSLISKTKSEDQCISLVWPKVKHIFTRRCISTKLFIAHQNVLVLPSSNNRNPEFCMDC